MRMQGTVEEGAHGSLWEVWPGMEYLREQMEAWKVFFDDVDPDNTLDTLPSQAARHSSRTGPHWTEVLHNQLPLAFLSIYALNIPSPTYSSVLRGYRMPLSATFDYL